MRALVALLVLAAAWAATIGAVVLGLRPATETEARPACRCKCPAEMHDHHRAGSDCGYCGRAICPSYRPDHSAESISRSAPPGTERVALASGGWIEYDVHVTHEPWPDDLELLADLTRDSLQGAWSPSPRNLNVLR